MSMEQIETRLRDTLHDSGGDGARLGLDDVRRRATIRRRAQRRRWTAGIAGLVVLPVVVVAIAATRTDDRLDQVRTATTAQAQAVVVPWLVPTVLPDGVTVQGASALGPDSAHGSEHRQLAAGSTVLRHDRDRDRGAQRALRAGTGAGLARAARVGRARGPRRR